VVVFLSWDTSQTPTISMHRISSKIQQMRLHIDLDLVMEPHVRLRCVTEKNETLKYKTAASSVD
jgi:hypothetical protein